MSPSEAADRDALACRAARMMSAHRVIAADRHRVPAPFRAFAVRSDEPRHAHDARAPYGRVHVVPAACLDGPTLALLAAEGHGRVDLQAFSDIDYAGTSFEALAASAPGAAGLAAELARALQVTGVLGDEITSYRAGVAGRIDYLASWGAGFHNDVSGHWSGCLFWVLALEATDVEFVMPHAGVRVPVEPGGLVVFDPAMAHGLCRPRDAGLAVAESFEAGPHRHQIFLTGELLLEDARWSALGSPWLPVEEHERRAALDLMVATFDDRSGRIQGVRALRDCMKRSTCHVDATGR